MISITKKSIYYKHSDYSTRYKNFTRAKNLASWNKIELFTQNSPNDSFNEYFQSNSGPNYNFTKYNHRKFVRYDQFQFKRATYCDVTQIQLFFHAELISTDTYNIFHPMIKFFKGFELRILVRFVNQVCMFKFMNNQKSKINSLYNKLISGSMTVLKNMIIPEIYPYRSVNNIFVTLSNRCFKITYSNDIVILSPSDKSYKYSISVIVEYLFDFQQSNN